MMAQLCCWRIFKILFLLSITLMFQHSVVAIPIGMSARNDLIDGNEFLSLFLDRDDFQRPKASLNVNDEDKILVDDDLIESRETRKEQSASLENSSETTENDGKSKQVVKLVTSGSKIVFFEELNQFNSNDEDRNPPTASLVSRRRANKSPEDEVKVVAVSVSSTVGHGRQKNNHNNKLNTARSGDGEFQEAIYSPDDSIPAQKPSRPLRQPTKDFVNLSHKSEFSIEEVEPLTQTKSDLHHLSDLDDSVNSESNNVQNILLVQQFNSTNNQSPNSRGNLTALAQLSRSTHKLSYPNAQNPEKLVPFQTVIYHDSKPNHGPQSRSISYSSIAQNIDELNSWKGSELLIQARRNVSESLNGMRTISETPSSEGRPAKLYSVPSKMYSVPAKFYSEPAKVYSEPAKMYGLPEKQYGEPSKVYSEPSIFYSEPAKMYSQPSKMYGEPSKTYWPNPTTTSSTSTTTTTSKTTNHPWGGRNQHGHVRDRVSTYQVNRPNNANSRRILFNLDKLPYDLLNDPEQAAKKLLDPTQARPCHDEPLRIASQRTLGDLVKCSKPTKKSHHVGISTERSNLEEFYAPTPEQNYEIEESVSVMTNGRAHGVQLSVPVTTARTRSDSNNGGSGDGGDDASKQNNNGQINVNASTNQNVNNHDGDSGDDDDDESKVGYVVEGRNFRKYRVEEKTPDGFIVGEYGVVSNNDGNLRGVRYTADSNINPSLIHQALMKFLSL